MTVPMYDVEQRRFGALGWKELETAIVGVPRELVEGALQLHLNTLGPGDKLVLEIERRR